MGTAPFFLIVKLLTARSLLAAKSSAFADIAAASRVVQESKMHVSFCTQWGVDLAELESTPESPACAAYGAYMMDVGMQGPSNPTVFLFFSGCSHL